MKQIEIRKNEQLKNYTTLHIGGNCKNIYFPKNEEEVKEVLKVNPIILGKGSNVLIDDTKEFEKNFYNMLEQEKCMKSNEDII